MGWVTIRHPVTGGEAQVDERSVGHWAACGWVAVEQEPGPKPEAATAEGDAGGPDNPSGHYEPARQETGPDQQE